MKTTILLLLLYNFSNLNAQVQQKHSGSGDNVGRDKIVNNTYVVKERDKFKKILINKHMVVVPAHTIVDIPIVITNNYPYPVFDVIIVFEVLEGDIDMEKNFVPFGNGVWRSKYVSCQINQMNSLGNYTYFWHIDASNYDHTSRIKLSVPTYSLEPFPNFSIHSDTLPKTISLPPDFIPNTQRKN